MIQNYPIKTPTIEQTSPNFVYIQLHTSIKYRNGRNCK